MDIRNFSLLLVFCCILRCYNAENAKGQQQQQLKSAIVVGTVYCDTCFHHELSKASRFIPGASVAVECVDSTTTARFTKEAKTNRRGVFRVRLPVKISKNIDNIKACSVKLIRSSEPFCAVAASATSTGLHIKFKRNGLHVFSAGFFTFRPLKQPELCYQQQKPAGSAKYVLFANQKAAQPALFFPPVPFVPSPGLPLPPNPLVPPPSLLPPVIPSLLPPVIPPPLPPVIPPVMPPPLPPVIPPVTPPPLPPVIPPVMPPPLPPVIPPPLPPVIPPVIPPPLPPVIPPIFPSPPPSILPHLPNFPPVPLLVPPPSPPPASIFPPFPIPLPPNPLFSGNPPHPAETSP